MTQLAIDFEPAHAARRRDPETSHTAARNAEHFAGTHAGRILTALKTHGPRNAHDLEALVGLSVVQIDRRLPDLKKAKLARVAKLDDGADQIKNGARVWEAVE